MSLWRRASVIVLAAGKGSRFAARVTSSRSRSATSTVLRHHLEAGDRQPSARSSSSPRRLGGWSRAQRCGARCDRLAGGRRRRARPDWAGFIRSPAEWRRAFPMRSGWLILPGDMPQVQTRNAAGRRGRQLADNPVVYAQYKGRRGHPVGFSSELYSELVVLSGDEGARRLIARYPASRALRVDDLCVLIDVDTLACDLENDCAEASLESSSSRAPLNPKRDRPKQASEWFSRASATSRSTSLSRIPHLRSEVCGFHQVIRACCRTCLAAQSSSSTICEIWQRAGVSGAVAAERECKSHAEGAVRRSACEAILGHRRRWALACSIASQSSAAASRLLLNAISHAAGKRPRCTSANTRPGQSGVPRLTRERILKRAMPAVHDGGLRYSSASNSGRQISDA